MQTRKRLIISPKDELSEIQENRQGVAGWIGRIFHSRTPGTYIQIPLFGFIAGVLVLGIGLAVLLFNAYFIKKDNVVQANPVTPAAVPEKTQLLPGINYSAFSIQQEVLDRDRQLDALLTSLGFSATLRSDMLEEARKKEVNTLEKGHALQIFRPKDGGKERTIVVYEISPDKMAEIKAAPFPQVNIHLRNTHTKLRAAGGIIKTTLWEAVLDRGIHYQVLDRMNEALKWSVDLYHLNVGDKFKVVYDEYWVDDELVSIGKLHAVYLRSNGKEYYAFLLDDVSEPGYYDQSGKPVRRTFLKAPLKYGRISSYFSPERLHPVLGDIRAHKGTDYAAPTGTPILAVADGEVETASETSNNGKFVKIRHDHVYETQYLHMSGFADGVETGTRVRQGQVIGFVGQTGLATGPHVCYRFWKNGEQVDPRLEAIDQPVLMTLSEEDRFLEQKDSLLPVLRRIVYFEGI